MAAAILTLVDDKLELDLSPCKGGDFRDALAKTQELPGRRFDYDRKIWMVEAKADVAERILATIRPEATNELRAWVRESRIKETEELTTPLPEDGKVLVPWGRKRQPWQPDVVNDEKFTGLLPYQRADVAHMARQRRVLNALDMGLGKTMEAISAVEEYVLLNGTGDGVTFPEGPRLVVAPNSVKGSWLRELNRWLDDPPVQMVDGASPATRHDQIQRGILDNAWVIVNWEQLRVKREKIKVQRRGGGTGSRTITLMKEPLFEFPGGAEWELSHEDWTWREHAKAKRDKLMDGWLAVLADEVHRAKNPKAQQTQGLHRTCGKVMIGMTGTPLMNSPDELWSVLHWLYPMEYTSYWDFFYKYVQFYENAWEGKVITGVNNPDALRFELKDRLVRRTAAILGLKGRKRIYYTLTLNPKQQKLYDDAEKAMWLEVEKQIEEGNEAAIRFAQEAESGATSSSLMRIPNGAARMVRLQQIIENSANVGGDDDSALMDDFEQKVADAGPKQQWVAGFKFKLSCELMRDRLEKHGVKVGLYTGDVDPQDRTKLEDEFQKGDIDVIVGTIAALKEGITLTSAHLMFQATEDHVPANNEQFESRCDRLGQQELVRIWKPQAENTVATDKVRPNNRAKEKIVSAVIQKDKIEEVIG